MLQQGARCPEVGWTAGRPGARDTCESARGDAGGQSTAGVTRAPVPPPRGTVPPPSAGHARTPRLRGGGPGARRAPHAPGPRLPRPRSAPGRGHSVTPPPPPATPLVPGLLRAEHHWTVRVGSARGGLAPKAGAVSGTAAPPGALPGHRTIGTLPFGGRGCGVPRSTSVGVRAPLVKQSRYLGPGQANQSGFCKKTSKMTAGRVYGTARRQFHRIPGMSHRRARCPGRRRPGPGDGAGAAEAGCPRRCSRLSVLQPNSSNDNIQSVTSGDWDVTRILSYDEKRNKM